MRPRQERRGEPGTRCADDPPVAGASMRPRQERRGEPGYPHQFDFQPSSFNAATAGTPWRTWVWANLTAALRALQCGHGRNAVENSLGRHPYPVAYQGFNAATAGTPW